MDFDPTSENVTTMLVVGLAILAMTFLMRKKYDSNLPLLFYFIAVLFSNMTDKSVNPYVMFSGLAFALILRFEFMNTGFSKLIAFCATASIGVIVYIFLAEVFGGGQAPF